MDIVATFLGHQVKQDFLSERVAGQIDSCSIAEPDEGFVLLPRH